MIVRSSGLLIALLLAGCAGGLRAQAPAEDTPPPAATDEEARKAAGETVEVTADRPRDDDAESEEAESEAEEAAEEWKRPGEIGPPNHWLMRPPPAARQFDAFFSPDLPSFESRTFERPEAGHAARSGDALHGSLRFSLAPSRWNGRPRTLTRPGVGGITTITGSDQYEAGVTLGGRLFQERLEFEISHRPSWWRRHERMALEEADQALDQADAVWANRDIARGWRRASPYSLSLGWSPGADHRITLRLHGAPARQSGTLRALGQRLSAEDDFGIATQPAPQGAPVVDPEAGAQGTRHLSDHAIELHYRGALPHHFELEAAATWHRSRSHEAPDAGSDTLMFIDNRRRQIYHYQAVNGITPVTTPAQYRFGGLGWYDGGSETGNLALHLQLARRFNAAGVHTLKYGLQYVEHRVGENYLLNSGPRGDAGTLASLYTSFFDWTGGVTRLRSGAYAEVNCVAPNPAAGGFAGTCPDVLYTLVRAPLNPRLPLAARRDWSAFIQEDWSFGRLQLTLGLRYLKSRIDHHGDYSLTGALTGLPLLGPDGNPVGTRDPDNPYENSGGEPDRPGPAPSAPRYVAGPGRFVGGGYRFPAAVSPRLGLRLSLAENGKSLLYFNAARLFDELPDELVYRAFTSEFGLARASFANPDFTDQVAGTLTYGGLLRSVRPGTRLGYADHLRAGWEWQAGHGVRLVLEGRYRRQGRVLAVTQANAVEAIANFYYDRLIRRQCLNCTTFPLFPEYPAGTSAAARGALSPTLANPGDNTPPGLFGRPSRRDESLTLTLSRETGTAGRFFWEAQARIARAEGNYAGVMVQANGSGEERFSSLFDYPQSRLTRSLYASGPLDPDQGSSLRMKAAWSDLFIKGLNAEIAWRWRQGTLRTPYLRNPFSLYTGLIPGSDPDYYRFNIANRGYADLLVMRDFTPARRGALGRNPPEESWDFALHYRRAAGRGTLGLRLEVRNLFNQTRVLSYEDGIEPEYGYPDPVSSGPSGESIAGAGAASAGGYRNPVYGLPATVQLPRQIRVGVEWSF